VGNKVIAVATFFAALMFVASALGSAQSWRVLGRGSASGDFAVAAANGTAKHPYQMAVRLFGIGVGSKTASFKGAGIHILRLPMFRADSCVVTASVSGSGHVVVQILAR
jgi:hypothetical protein